MNSLLEALATHKTLLIQQRHELAELIGFETRNKYEIRTESNNVLGFAAESQKGVLGFLFRQFLGHWRRFEVQIFDNQRQLVFVIKHPFRFIFQRIDVHSPTGQLVGSLQQRFAIFSKKFDVTGPRDELLFKMHSPLWRLWTFKFFRKDIEYARVEKKWAGILSEAFTDKDLFRVNFANPSLTPDEKALLMCAAIFIDLNYFEHKAR
jgi:uncharacterized protein YxjI